MLFHSINSVIQRVPVAWHQAQDRSALEVNLQQAEKYSNTYPHVKPWLWMSYLLLCPSSAICTFKTRFLNISFEWAI